MKKFILTVGPALLHEVPLRDIHSSRNIYRINGAHGMVEDISRTIEEIRKQIPDAEIMIDLPGNKIRTKDFSEPMLVERGACFEIPVINFNYPKYYQHLRPGMIVWANDSTLKFVVENANETCIRFRSESTGLLENNKGMHVRDIHANIPFLFVKDIELITLINEKKVDYAGLSFVRTADNIREAKRKINNSCRLVSKIETKEAVENLSEILKEVEFILIDRGDLSADIGICKVPKFQKHIIEAALYNSKKVFLATQILKTMEAKPVPTIAEINDLYTIWKMGVYGVQLSEETAVGKYVRECIAFLSKMDEEISRERLV